jgi:AcrR family transcriptional regulator
VTAIVRKPGRPRDPDLEIRRRAEILEAAAAIFATNGFAGTQVQTLADKLGVGNGTIYRYFPTKEELFLAAVERGLVELTNTIEPLMAADLEPVETLRQIVKAYLRFFHRRPEMAELFIQERAAFPKHHRPLYFASKDENDKECKRADLFRRLVAAKAVRPMPAERFFSVIGDLLYGTILTNLLTGRCVKPDLQADDVLDVIFHGVLTDGERRKGKR